MCSCNDANSVANRLVTDGTRDTALPGRHFRTGLHEAENVVSVEQIILTLLVKDKDVRKDRLRVQRLVLLDRAAGHDLVVHIVALACALTQAIGDTVFTMLQGDGVDLFHDHDGLADTGTSEEPISPPAAYGASMPTTLMPINIAVPWRRRSHGNHQYGPLGRSGVAFESTPRA